jgi:hypothetical protein
MYMSLLRKTMFGVIFGLLILLAATIYLPPAKTMWVRHSGAVIPNGSRTLVFTDKPFRILSVEGQRWVDGRLLEASAYHALVIFPIVIPKDDYSSSGGDGFTHTDLQSWLVPIGERSANGQTFEKKELAITYDSLWQTITLHSRTYHLTQGNLFVIRFDQNWQPAVSQLNVTINTDADHDEEVRAFKTALKDDALVQQL